MDSVSYPHIDAQPGQCLWCGTEVGYFKNGKSKKYCGDYCSTSASSFRRTGRIAPLPWLRESREGSCKGCGELLVRGSRERNGKKWCSDACRVRTYYRNSPDKRIEQNARNRERAAAKSAAKGSYPKCLNCGSLLKSRRADFKYCNSQECQSVKKRTSPENAAECSFDGCNRHAVSRGLCSSHYSTEWRRAHPGRHAVNQQKRRALKKSAFVEDVDLMVVLERDNWMCMLCGKKIPKGAEYPDPLYRTVDHVVPLHVGGEHSYANVQSAHFGCNAAKGFRGGGEQLALI